MRASCSIMNLPASAACQLVPQATMRTLVELRELLRRDLHLVEEDAAGFLADAAEDGVADGARLLKDFLEHEVLVAALFRHDGVPQNVRDLALHGLAVEVASGARRRGSARPCRRRPGRTCRACGSGSRARRRRRSIRRRPARPPPAGRCARRRSCRGRGAR